MDMLERAFWHSPASSAGYIRGVYGSVNPGVVGRGRCALPKGKGNGADAFQRAVSRLIDVQGEVVAIGPGARGDDGKLNPLDVKAGDRILYGKWSGTEVKIDGEDLLIMKESDIMGVIEGTKAARRKAA